MDSLLRLGGFKRDKSFCGAGDAHGGEWRNGGAFTSGAAKGAHSGEIARSDKGHSDLAVEHAQSPTPAPLGFRQEVFAEEHPQVLQDEVD